MDAGAIKVTGEIERITIRTKGGEELVFTDRKDDVVALISSIGDGDDKILSVVGRWGRMVRSRLFAIRLTTNDLDKAVVDTDGSVAAARLAGSGWTEHEHFYSRHMLTDEGLPDGGQSNGLGIKIAWQKGLLPKNGAFVDTVIKIALDRLEHFQTTKFCSIENAIAIGHLKAALEALNVRQQLREARGVANTHES